MPLTEATKNEALDAIGLIVGFASLHTNDPGTTGANEVSGGSPAYARIAVVWDPATGAVLSADLTTPIVFNVPAGTTVRFGGLWDPDGVTFRGGDAVTEVAFSGQGTYELSAITVTATDPA